MTEILERKLRMLAKKRAIPKESTDTFVLDNMSKRYGWTPEEKEKHRKELIK